MAAPSPTIWRKPNGRYRATFSRHVPNADLMNAFPVPDVPEIHEADDLATIVADRVDLESGDVVCVASTVVSKAEGRKASLEEFSPGDRARSIADRLSELEDEPKDPRFAQAVLEESEELLLESPFLLAVTRFGHVTVNAGVDRSNVPDADLLLLPESPGESASRLSEELESPVVVTDTSGRPFRYGQRGVAIGWAGMPAARDWRGERDRDGRELDVTVQAVVDELAATANLVAGEGGGGTPIVVIRGWSFGDHRGSDDLFRTEADDVVRQALRDWEGST